MLRNPHWLPDADHVNSRLADLIELINQAAKAARAKAKRAKARKGGSEPDAGSTHEHEQVDILEGEWWPSG